MSKLKKWNEKPYSDVIEAFNNGKKRVCIIRPTGSGKSYIAYEVAKNFHKVLVLAPNNYILQQNEEIIGSNGIEYISYPLLNSIYKSPENHLKGYDLIITDEFHRLGAKQWSKAYANLLIDNPKAYVLGLTATETRYLDDNRDMARELFGLDRIVNKLTLSEAWEQHILKAPTYVIGSLDFDKELEELEKLTKETILEHDLSDIKVDWSKSGGISGIFKKYLRPDLKRLIVFNDRVKNYSKMKEDLTRWLHEAGFMNFSIYEADVSVKDVDSVISAFNRDKSDNLKILVSVNMLNEGIHAEGCEGVIMFRSTCSKNIFQQQIGRCMCANPESKKPIVIDLVDNLYREDYIWDFTSGLQQPISEEENDKNDDYVLEVDDLLIRYKNLLERYEEILSIYSTYLEKFKKLGRMVTPKDGKNLYNWIMNQIKKGNQEVIKIAESYGYHYVPREETYSTYLEKFKKLGRMVTPKDGKNLYVWVMKHIRKGNLEVIKIAESYGYHYVSKEEIYSTYLEKFKKLGRMVTPKDGKSLYKLVLYHIKKGNQEVIKIAESYGYHYVSNEEIYSDNLEKFKKLGRMVKKEDGESFYVWVMKQIRKGNQEVIKIAESYGYHYVSKKKTYSTYLEKFKKLGRMVKREDKIYSWVMYHIKKGDQEVIKIAESYGYHYVPRK